MEKVYIEEWMTTREINDKRRERERDVNRENGVGGKKDKGGRGKTK